MLLDTTDPKHEPRPWTVLAADAIVNSAYKTDFTAYIATETVRAIRIVSCFICACGCSLWSCSLILRGFASWALCTILNIAKQHLSSLVFLILRYDQSRVQFDQVVLSKDIQEELSVRVSMTTGKRLDLYSLVVVWFTLLITNDCFNSMFTEIKGDRPEEERED